MRKSLTFHRWIISGFPCSNIGKIDSRAAGCFRFDFFPPVFFAVGAQYFNTRTEKGGEPEHHHDGTWDYGSRLFVAISNIFKRCVCLQHSWGLSSGTDYWEHVSRSPADRGLPSKVSQPIFNDGAGIEQPWTIWPTMFLQGLHVATTNEIKSRTVGTYTFWMTFVVKTTPKTPFISTHLKIELTRTGTCFEMGAHMVRISFVRNPGDHPSKIQPPASAVSTFIRARSRRPLMDGKPISSPW